eukprot:8034303-Pyramimonas_sp.AAC.1
MIWRDVAFAGVPRPKWFDPWGRFPVMLSSSCQLGDAASSISAVDVSQLSTFCLGTWPARGLSAGALSNWPSFETLYHSSDRVSGGFHTARRP